MRVFISWSGEKSRRVALVLREWLPLVVNSIEPFVSDEDIHSGTRWQGEVASELEGTNFGIVCVTTENQTAPWLNFEAGALAKAVDGSRVIPLAVDLKPSDIELPLGQFHAQPATRQGMRKVLASLNAVCERPLDDERLRRAGDKWWSDLDAQLKGIGETGVEQSSPTDARTVRDLLEETLDTVRGLARTAGSAQLSMPQAAGLRLHPEHPLIGELAELARSFDENAEVVPSMRTRMVRVMTKAQPPDDLITQMRVRAGIYGAGVMFRPFPVRVRRIEAAKHRTEEFEALE